MSFIKSLIVTMVVICLLATIVGINIKSKGLLGIDAFVSIFSIVIFFGVSENMRYFFWAMSSILAVNIVVCLATLFAIAR